jgi:hypothetical protein
VGRKDFALAAAFSELSSQSRASSLVEMTSAVIFLLVLRIFCTLAAGVPAPDDSEATVLPPSLVVSRRYDFLFHKILLGFP